MESFVVIFIDIPISPILIDNDSHESWVYRLIHQFWSNLYQTVTFEIHSIIDIFGLYYRPNTFGLEKHVTISIFLLLLYRQLKQKIWILYCC